MNKEYRVVAAIFSAIFVACTSVFTARAAVESVTVSYPNLEVGAEAPLSFPMFDPSLGTLTDIMIKLTSNDAVESIVYNPSSSLAGYYTCANATASVTVTALSGVSTTTTLHAGPGSGTIQPNSFVVAATESGNVVNSVHVPPSGYAQYIGSGDQTFDLTVQQSAGIYSGSYRSPSAQLFFGGDASSFGSVEIDYTYAAVPEMSTAFTGLTALAVSTVVASKMLHRSRKPETTGIRSINSANRIWKWRGF